MKTQTDTDKIVTESAKSGIARRIFKGLCYFILIVILLNVLIYITLSVPYFQQKVLAFAIDKIKDITKTEVSIDEIQLSLLNNISLKGIYIEDLSKDTLIYAKNLDVSLDPWKLIQKKVLIQGIELDEFTLNISQATPTSNYNFQFLIDAFSDSTNVSDTTASSLLIEIENINLHKGSVKYNVLSEPVTPNVFDASHIYIRDLNANLKLPSLDLLNFKAELLSLSLKEQSGLEIKNFKGIVNSKNTIFYLKDVALNLPYSELKIPEASYNLLNNKFEVRSEQSLLSPKDLVTFMPDIKYLKNDIGLQTEINGQLPNITVSNLNITYGKDAMIDAKASISDYSDYENADLELNIKNFLITQTGIADFAMLGDSTFVSPDILNTMGDIRLVGELTGKLSDLHIKAESWAKQGSILMSAIASTDTSFQNFNANVKLQTQNFNLGALLENNDIGRLSANIELVASQKSNVPLKINSKGRINTFSYNKQPLNNIPFTAFYNNEKMGLSIDVNLKQGLIKAEMEMTQQKTPKISLDMIITKLQLDKFIDLSNWKNSLLSLKLKADINGTDINTMTGNLDIEDFNFSHDTLSFRPGKMSLSFSSENPDNKHINLNTSFLQANINGKYNFMTISDELNNSLSQFMPSFFKKTKNKIKNANNFKFDVSLQNMSEMEKVFELPVQIPQPITLSGVINTIEDKLAATAKIPMIQYGSTRVKGGTINLFNTDTVLSFRANTMLSHDANDLLINFSSDTKSDTIKSDLRLKSESKELNIDANFNALAHLERDKMTDLVSTLQFNPSEINIGKLNLNFMPARIVNDGDITKISNFGFTVGKGRMFTRFFGVDGVISNNKEDTLNVNFTNAQIGDILQAADINNIATVINGDIKFVNVLDKPEMYTDNFSLSDIIVFNDTLGDLKVSSYWSDKDDGIRFASTLDKNGITHSTTKGLVYPARDSLDLDIHLDKFSLNWMEPFMEGLLNKLDGSISSELKATGKMTAPLIHGWLGVNDVDLGVDYTNVTYHISDTIRISPDKIGFDNLVVQDPLQNNAIVNAEITHKDFNNLQYNLDVSMNNLLVLNTQNRTDSLFYGKIFASGTANIKGTDESVNIKMNVRNGKNSNINIQIPQTTDAMEYQGIVYINTPAEASEQNNITQEATPFPLKLAVDLNVNKNISIGVVINPLTGDYMQIEGVGLVKFTYDMASDNMNTFGNYIISNGKVKLRLQNIATMEFIIQDGSKLVMNGDPLKTNFDITAYKRVRADLSTLNESFATGNNASKVTVDCVLGISGNMEKMNLTYDIRLPDAPEDIQQKLRSLISTDEQKTLQFAYLLVTGAFHGDNSTGKGGNMAEGMLTSIASSAISNGLNALLGNVLGSKWQIGSNISSNDGTFSDMDMSVSVSRTFLDDKLKFNTNLGYRTDQTLATENSLIGDFEVEYALTKSISVKAFNKTNNQFYKQAPTTQGVGIVYTKEAKKIKDLFKIFRKKRKKTKQSKTLTND